ncbi:MAG: endonuclease/exonuclease/phosphatase family protein [Bradymonadaceae bacterium]
MTYNIRLGLQEGLAPIARIIKESRADIVALQEVGRHWTHGPDGDTTTELSMMTGLEHAIYAPAIHQELEGRKPAEYGHALLSRWPVADHTIVSLPQLEDESRLLLFSIIESPVGLLKIISTHLSHRESDRPTQAAFLLERIEGWLGEDGPHLLMGDLNSPPTEEWMGRLQEMMSDADKKAERLTFPASEPNRRIDYLFVRGGRWGEVDVIEEVEASDHRPLVATWEPDEASP